MLLVTLALLLLLLWDGDSRALHSHPILDMHRTLVTRAARQGRIQMAGAEESIVASALLWQTIKAAAPTCSGRGQ